jgi:hypothetical protein
MTEALVPKCDGCDEPRELHRPGWRACELKKIAVKAEEGCLTCSLVKEGVYQFVAESKQPEMIILNWSMSGGKSIVARVNGTTLISYYISESTCPSRQPIVILCIIPVLHFVAKHNIELCLNIFYVLSSTSLSLLRHSITFKHVAVMADWIRNSRKHVLKSKLVLGPATIGALQRFSPGLQGHVLLPSA